MKYKGVIFDLFGTLVPAFPRDEYVQNLTKMADILGVPSEEFIGYWFGETWEKRAKGFFSRIEENIEYIVQILGKNPDITLTRAAVDARMEFIKERMTPKPEALEIIKSLKQLGYKLGLISDCSAEVATLWPENPLADHFDSTVLSVLARTMKPDPKIYLICASELGLDPEEIVYVGDGDSNELEGARDVGMLPILIRDSGENKGREHRIIDIVEDWDGLKIDSLRSLLTLLETL